MEWLKEPIHFTEMKQLQWSCFRSGTVGPGFLNGGLLKRRKLIRIEAELKIPLVSGELYKKMLRGGGGFFYYNYYL